MRTRAPLPALLVFAATSPFGCARIHETRTAHSYETAEVTRRTHLADEGLSRMAVRQHGTLLEVELADVQRCRDEVSARRGVEVTTRRERTTRAVTAEWIAFGATAGMSLVSYSAASQGCDDPQALMCGGPVLGVMGMVVFIPAAVVTGFVLLIDSSRAADETEKLELGSRSYTSVQVCRQTPRDNVRVAASSGGVRVESVTDELGRVALDLALPQYPQQITTVELALDGMRLGSIPVSNQPQNWLIRRNAH